ncbi:hypothetical protein L1987_12820 [Smallanthus sonchifolius]|uniref:Uncharacterized protein n=1 Tax=Smallanthus sonchifolius TaxID=185202 RepID=A0ACB9JGC8_9ASTR|nr:hypothetical protein L1987_12820 [Smallanthus sonchifolius]
MVGFHLMSVEGEAALPAIGHGDPHADDKISVHGKVKGTTMKKVTYAYQESDDEYVRNHAPSSTSEVDLNIRKTYRKVMHLKEIRDSRDETAISDQIRAFYASVFGYRHCGSTAVTVGYLDLKRPKAGIVSAIVLLANLDVFLLLLIKNQVDFYFLASLILASTSCFLHDPVLACLFKQFLLLFKQFLLLFLLPFDSCLFVA